jgi:hypothetical protein
MGWHKEESHGDVSAENRKMQMHWVEPEATLFLKVVGDSYREDAADVKLDGKESGDKQCNCFYDD